LKERSKISPQMGLAVHSYRGGDLLHFSSCESSGWGGDYRSGAVTQKDGGDRINRKYVVSNFLHKTLEFSRGRIS